MSYEVSIFNNCQINFKSKNQLLLEVNEADFLLSIQNQIQRTSDTFWTGINECKLQHVFDKDQKQRSKTQNHTNWVYVNLL